MDAVTWAVLIYAAGVPLVMGGYASYDDEPDNFVPAGVLWPIFILFIAAFVIAKKLSNTVSKEP